MTDVTRTMAWALLQMYALTEQLEEARATQGDPSADRASVERVDIDGVLTRAGIGPGDTLPRRVYGLVQERDSHKANAETRARDLAETRQALEEERADVELKRAALASADRDLAEARQARDKATKESDDFSALVGRAWEALREESRAGYGGPGGLAEAAKRVREERDALRAEVERLRAGAFSELSASAISTMETMRAEKPEPRTLSREEVRAMANGVEVPWEAAESVLHGAQRRGWLSVRLPEGA